MENIINFLPDKLFKLISLLDHQMKNSKQVKKLDLKLFILLYLDIFAIKPIFLFSCIDIKLFNFVIDKILKFFSME